MPQDKHYGDDWPPQGPGWIADIEKNPAYLITETYDAIEKLGNYKIYEKPRLGTIAGTQYWSSPDKGKVSETTGVVKFEGYTPRLDLKAYRPRTLTEISMDDENIPAKLIIAVNDDNDEQRAVGSHDNDNDKVVKDDDDLFKLELYPLQPRLATGNIYLKIPKVTDKNGNEKNAVRVFYEDADGKKQLLEDFILDLDNPADFQLFPLSCADGRAPDPMVFWIEGLEPCADAAIIYKHTHEDAAATMSEAEDYITHQDALHFTIARVDLNVDSDNNGVISPDDPSEDDIENPQTVADIEKYPGKICPVNTGGTTFDPADEILFPRMQLRLRNLGRNEVFFLFEYEESLLSIYDDDGNQFLADTRYDGETVPEILYLEAMLNTGQNSDDTPVIRVKVFSKDTVYGEDEWVLDDAVRIMPMQAKLESSWLVTHDPKFEKNYVKNSDSSCSRHAELMNNRAKVLVDKSVAGMNYALKLYYKNQFMVKAWESGESEKDMDVYYFRTDTDGENGAETDADGGVYIEKKLLPKVPSLDDYEIRLTIGETQISPPFKLEIGPLMTDLAFSPKILNGKTLDPYSHSVDVKWDAPWPWSEDEEGFGLEMLYDLVDDVKELKFEFDDAPGGKGDMGGIHDLLVNSDYMKEASNFFTNAYNVKWEGFDSAINDEEAHRIYAYPDEAEKSTIGISPPHTVKEGKYLHRIEMKRDKDDTQIQKYEIQLEVKYETK